MGRAKQLREIFATSFDDSAKWQNWFFGTVATDDNDAVVVHNESGRPMSALFMQPYTFAYAGAELPSVYLSCVATRPEARGKGYASKLMFEAMKTALERGAVFAELIPANESLYRFYSRFGFSGCVYAAEERYTSIHAFRDDGAEVLEPDAAQLRALEREFGCGVIHSDSDYRNIYDDLMLESTGEVVSVRTPGGANAFLFAFYNTSKTDSGVTVRSLMAENEEAADAALAELRRRVGERSIAVFRPARHEPQARLHPRGMIRIVNAEAVLGALAAANPQLHHCIRLTDSQLPHNSGVYVIRDGACTRSESAPRHIDLDVTSETLCAILFSAPATGNIFSLPTRRPYMSMMLD
ncbi:MAG: GNAT family N-acetyltransferase [Muribaculaceae bacterium]|nr:GNAT family N-acetyltransferase [Muribaculaceae bacterium]